MQPGVGQSVARCYLLACRTELSASNAVAHCTCNESGVDQSAQRRRSLKESSLRAGRRCDASESVLQGIRASCNQSAPRWSYSTTPRRIKATKFVEESGSFQRGRASRFVKLLAIDGDKNYTCHKLDHIASFLPINFSKK